MILTASLNVIFAMVIAFHLIESKRVITMSSLNEGVDWWLHENGGVIIVMRGKGVFWRLLGGFAGRRSGVSIPKFGI